MKKKSVTFDVRPELHYKRLSNGEVLSGEQVILLLQMANPAMQAIILLDIHRTTEPINNTLRR